MDRLISQILNRLIGTLVNRGVNAGVNAAFSGKGKGQGQGGEAAQSAAEAEQAQAGKAAVRRTARPHRKIPRLRFTAHLLRGLRREQKLNHPLSSLRRLLRAPTPA